MLINFKSILKIVNIKGIIHVGAHELEELPFYLGENIKNIIWIEANPGKYELIENKIKIYKNMILGKFAASDRIGEAKLNISNNGLSSSLLELGTHAEDYPDIFYNSKTNVRTDTLDNWLNKNMISKEKYNFINLDIQGFEYIALNGMREQLDYADYIYLEVNFKEVYKGCHKLKDIDSLLNKFKFSRVAIKRTNAGWGDALYVKRFILINKIYYNFLFQIEFLFNLPKRIILKIIKLIQIILKK